MLFVSALLESEILVNYPILGFGIVCWSPQPLVNQNIGGETGTITKTTEIIQDLLGTTSTPGYPKQSSSMVTGIYFIQPV